MDIKIRELSYNDKPAYVECLKQLYPNTKLDKKFSYTFEQRFNLDNLYTYVATHSIQDTYNIYGAASIILEPKFGHNLNAGYIQDVCVRKEMQGKGVGTKLIKFLIDFAKSVNCYKVELCSSVKNLTFYSEFGFKIYQNNMRIDL